MTHPSRVIWTSGYGNLNRLPLSPSEHGSPHQWQQQTRLHERQLAPRRNSSIELGAWMISQETQEARQCRFPLTPLQNLMQNPDLPTSPEAASSRKTRIDLTIEKKRYRLLHELSTSLELGSIMSKSTQTERRVAYQSNCLASHDMAAHFVLSRGRIDDTRQYTCPRHLQHSPLHICTARRLRSSIPTMTLQQWVLKLEGRRAYTHPVHDETGRDSSRGSS
ncbi:hypothetical protein F5146DRAFT_1176667 [Armillaria mellea]|nr:hypothetical protein F5146DRAFT_1176667 [Armillaria mellea]